jgi:hypothetical protein
VDAVTTFANSANARKKSVMRILTTVLLALVLAGCGTARTLVLEPPETNARFSSAALIAHNPTVEVPPEVTGRIEAVIGKGLFEGGAFTAGEDLRIYYTFISHEPGNRMERWFWGGIGNAGEGSVTIMVRYVDATERELARTQVEGRIGSGFFGGSINDAITRAGEDIVKFTIDRFAERERR